MTCVLAKTAALMAAVVTLAITTPDTGAATRQLAPGSGSLAKAISKAADYDTLELQPGTYHGPVTIDRPLTIMGSKGAVIDGAYKGTVVTIDAPNVEIRQLTIRHSGEDLSTEDSGIFVTANGDNAVIRGNTLDANLIGIYLKGPNSAVVSSNQIQGRQDLRMNERGNGIHLWNTPGSIIENNQIRYGRDGIFVTTSRENIFRDNQLTDLRFAIHYMYANDSEVSGNLSQGNDVGYALMYSSRLHVSNNQSIADRDRGIFFNFTNDSVIRDNMVRGDKTSPGPEKCVFIYNSNMNELTNNHFEACQIGVHFTAGSEQNDIWHNNFVANRNQVKYVGTRELEWSGEQGGNFWSDHIAFDIDGNGLADQTYKPNSMADQVIWRNPMAKILMNSPILHILAWAQSRFPALHPGGVTDSQPLMQPKAAGYAR